MMKCLLLACLVAAATVHTATQPEPTETCTMPNNEIGECVRYYLCGANNSVITDGSDIIDIRVRDGPCSSYLDTCCSVGNKRQPDDPITPSPVDQPVREGCGRWNKNGVGFKTTGDVNGEAKFGEFPWMVAILKLEPLEDISEAKDMVKVYSAGGSLIHPSVVLTVAHKVTEGGPFIARAGEWDTRTTKEIYPYQERDVINIVVHKDYIKVVLYYDIALLILKSPFDMAPNVGVVCLPPPRERTDGGTRCFASGWGINKFDQKNEYQVILKKVEVPVVEHRRCQTALRRTRLGPFFELHSSMMCAGGEPGVDTCTGDGGSPLVCPSETEPDRFVQRGIVAWGIGCGEDKYPGVYVDVSNLRNWIDNAVVGKSFDTNVYTY